MLNEIKSFIPLSLTTHVATTGLEVLIEICLKATGSFQFLCVAH